MRRDPVEEVVAMAAPESVTELSDTLFDLRRGDAVEIVLDREPGESPPPAMDLDMAPEPRREPAALLPAPRRREADQALLWSPGDAKPAVDHRRAAAWPLWAAVAALLVIVATGAYFAMRANSATSGQTGSGERDWTEAQVGGSAAPSSVRPPAGSPESAGSAPVALASSSSPAAAPATGRLLVRSSPDGAVVTIGGERRGTTPLVLRDLTFGPYDIRVTRAGYAPVERRISLSASEPSGSLVLTLKEVAASRTAPAPRTRPASRTQPAPRTPAASEARSGFGSIAVLSRPSGATVYVDGRAAGQTPVVVERIAVGSRAVRIELAGHRRWSTTVEVGPGARTRVAASLERGGTE
jgi:hypothetical protein